jgi:hypothetical protein
MKPFPPSLSGVQTATVSHINYDENNYVYATYMLVTLYARAGASSAFSCSSPATASPALHQREALGLYVCKSDASDSTSESPRSSISASSLGSFGGGGFPRRRLTRAGVLFMARCSCRATSASSPSCGVVCSVVARSGAGRRGSSGWAGFDRCWQSGKNGH